MFSKMDLKTGFHQIHINPSDKEKTDFNTEYGQYEYLVNPIGLCSAPATFVSLMNVVLEDFIHLLCLIYMDDILVFARTEEEHCKHMELIIQNLEHHKIFLSSEKFSFLKEALDLLGILVDYMVLRVNPEKAKAAKGWPIPTSVGDLLVFMGLNNFFPLVYSNYRRHRVSSDGIY